MKQVMMACFVLAMSGAVLAVPVSTTTIPAVSTVSAASLEPKFEDQESALVAMCVTGSTTPPVGLSSKVCGELSLIRSEFGDEVSQVELRFVPPWDASAVTIQVGTEAAKAVSDGTYTAWDGLNRQFGLKSIEKGFASSARMVALEFSGLKHPVRIAEAYSKLPGMAIVTPNYNTIDRPNIYPRLIEKEKLSYLFRNAWDDCLAGCKNNEYWYFEFTDDNAPVLIGYWNPAVRDTPPSWWAEAKKNIELYKSW